MNKPRDPRQLAIDLLNRSICSVQVAAVLADNWGIHSWGYNNVGSGFGEHAEAMCMRRANKRRVERSTLYVAATRRRNRKPVTARPCLECQSIVRRCFNVVWRDRDGVWKVL
jgi:deoxycytidylate deaminase